MTLFPPNQNQNNLINNNNNLNNQNLFLKIIEILEFGLTELVTDDPSISTSICSALDYILSFYYRETFIKKNLNLNENINKLNDNNNNNNQNQNQFQLFLLQKAQQQKDQGRLFLYSSFNSSNIVKNHFIQSGDIFPRILMKLFNIIIYEETGNQWAFSRVMLSLIVTHQQFFFNQLKPKIIETINSLNLNENNNNKLIDNKNDQSNKIINNNMSMEKDQDNNLNLSSNENNNLNNLNNNKEKSNNTIEQAFDQLLDGIEMNLEQKNKDKFTNNVITFRQSVRDLI